MNDMETALCGAKRRSGGTCRKPAGWGTSHNGYGQGRLHGGLMRNQNLHAAKLEAADKVAKLAVVMGLPEDADPLGALMGCIRIAAGEVAYCTSRIAELDESDAVVVYSERSEREGSKESYSETKRPSTAELNIWIRVRHGAMDRLAKYSKMALDAGVAERQIRVSEYLGEAIGKMCAKFAQALHGDFAAFDEAQGAGY